MSGINRKGGIHRSYVAHMCHSFDGPGHARAVPVRRLVMLNIKVVTMVVISQERWMGLE